MATVLHFDDFDALPDEDEDEDEDEILMLLAVTAAVIDYFYEHYEFQTPRPRNPIIPRERYSFANSKQDPAELFRFREEEIRSICTHMNEPRWHRTIDRDKFS